MQPEFAAEGSQLRTLISQLRNLNLRNSLLNPKWLALSNILFSLQRDVPCAYQVFNETLNCLEDLRLKDIKLHTRDNNGNRFDPDRLEQNVSFSFAVMVELIDGEEEIYRHLVFPDFIESIQVNIPLS